MNQYEAALRALKGDLSRLQARWALVGGFAVNAHGGGRFTTDIDVVAAVVSDEEAEQFVFRMQQMGYLAQTELEQESAGRLSTVRFRSPHSRESTVLVDVIFATTGIEAEIVQAAQDGEVLRGLNMPVVTRGHLIAMKVLSDNPERRQDIWDIETLLDYAAPQDLDDARAALQLIMSRGFNRGEDLGAKLDNILERLQRA
jgi:hypothetical protein